MEGSGVERVLEASRRCLRRVAPEDLGDEVMSGALVVDTRPERSRVAEGEMPGAIVVERTVLEWRVDPTSPDRLAEFDDPDARVIIVCNEGYSSSLAAETLQRLGMPNAADLIGGYRAWRALADSDAVLAARAPTGPGSRRLGHDSSTRTAQ